MFGPLAACTGMIAGVAAVLFRSIGGRDGTDSKGTIPWAEGLIAVAFVLAVAVGTAVLWDGIEALTALVIGS